MARAQDLAGLAALAGLGYMLSKKGDTATSTDTGGDSNPTRGAGYNSTETRPEAEAPRRQITDYMAKAPQDPREAGSETQSASSDVFANTAPVKPRNVVTGSNLPPVKSAVPAVGGDENYGNEGRGSKSPALMAMNEANGADTRSANRGDQLQDLSRAVNREAKTSKAAQGNSEGNVTYHTREFQNYDGTPNKPRQEMYDKAGANTQSAAKTDALAVASRAARAADAKRRAAKASGYKSGGSVSKVSSASKRADGIASKGKTRGRIC